MNSLCIVIPCHNESATLDENVRELVAFCRERLPEAVHIVLSENGSTDDTLNIGKALAASYPEVSMISLGRAGKGAAIRAAWEAAQEDTLMFMDADMATELGAVLVGLSEIEQGADLVIGCRLHERSRVERGIVRELGSRTYAALSRGVLKLPFRDFQCGFKMITRAAASALMPKVSSDGFFFDTELLALSHAAGLKIVELPVDWVETRNKKRTSAVSTSSFKIFGSMALKLFALRRRLRQ